MILSTEQVQESIKTECDALCAMLIEKNNAYGNSALNPVRCFSKADTIEQINVRLDDELSRLMRGHPAGEDTELVIAGYIILRRVAIKLARQTVETLSLLSESGINGAENGKRIADQVGVKMEELAKIAEGFMNVQQPERCSGCKHFKVREAGTAMNGVIFNVLCKKVTRGLAKGWLSEKEAKETVIPEWCPGREEK